MFTARKIHLLAGEFSGLKDASTVVFLGYRFPPTDAEARNRLLPALRENREAGLEVHTVLGPDVNASPSQRLSGLLVASIGKKRGGVTKEGASFSSEFDPIRHAMNAEDFLGLVHYLDSRRFT